MWSEIIVQVLFKLYAYLSVMEFHQVPIDGKCEKIK